VLAKTIQIELVTATCQTVFLSHRHPHHPHRSCDEMSFRQSFSRFRKKAKDKLSNFKDSTKGRGTSVGDEGLGHSGLSLQSEPAIVVEGELGEDAGVGAGSEGSRPGDSLPVSLSMAELEREPRGSDDYTAQHEHGQKGLHPQAHEQAGRRSSQERGDVDGKRVDRADPPRSESDIERRTPTPSILQDGEPESMWTAPFQPPPLTDDADNSAIPGSVRVGAVTSKDRSDWKRTTSSAAKLFLRTVKEVSDAFPPLKSVAGGLCAILDNCEVRSTFVCLIRDAYSSHSKQWSTNRR